MPTDTKIQIVKETEALFKESKAIYFAKYSGMNVSQATTLRKDFRANDVKFKITKNTLVRIAADNSGIELDKLNSFLEGQIAIAYAKDDPTSPAKVIKQFEKENEDSIEVVGLIFDGQFYEADKYKEFANLPSKEESLTKLAIGLNSPMTKFATTINSLMSKMLTALSALKDSKE